MTTILLVGLGIWATAFIFFEIHRQWVELWEFIGTSFDEDGLQ